MTDLIAILNERYVYKNDGFYNKYKFASNVNVNARAGSLEPAGYRLVRINKKIYKNID
jgi:hypothetical protein